MDRLDTLFPGRVEPSSTDYPGGAFRDKSTDTSNDGTPITLAKQINNIWGALLAILAKAGLSPDDITEKVSASQVANAIFSLQKLSNDALANDLSLGKFSQGTINFSVASQTLKLDPYALSVGDTTYSVGGRYSKYGTRFTGPSQPGTIYPYMRHSIHDITAFVSGASVSDSITETTDSHYHTIGKVYSNVLSTGVPYSQQIFDTVITSVTPDGKSHKLICEVEFDPGYLGSNDWVISRIIQSGGSQIDDISSATSVYMTMFFDGDYL